MSSDEAVQSTNDDASECKRSAVHLGYWQDQYIQILVRGSERKPPEINRGYFARTEGVNLFIKKFLKCAGEKSQIISFGAGFDTLYWRLREAQLSFDNFTEVDFPVVTARKCYSIKRSKVLLDGLGTDGEVRLSSTELHGGNYHLVGADLRNLNEVATKLRESEVNFQLPTLFLAECVLVYIESNCVSNLLSWIISRFPSAMFVNYEQVNMCDRFGEIMLENLRARGCPLSGVDACRSLDTQIKSTLCYSGFVTLRGCCWNDIRKLGPIMVGEGKPGWADSMLKIAKPSKKKADIPVLGEYVVKRVKKEDIKEEPGSSSDEETSRGSNSARKHEKYSIGRMKPNPLDGPKERQLSKIACRGVVQLFNAVKKHQSPSTMSGEKREFKSVDKSSFLDILSGNKIKEEESE